VVLSNSLAIAFIAYQIIVTINVRGDRRDGRKFQLPSFDRHDPRNFQ